MELLEAIAYLICQDDPIRVDTFYKIVSSRGVPAKILRLADTNYDGVVSVEEMMSFIMIITNPRLVLFNFHHFDPVWVLSLFYSVGFSQSQVSVKKGVSKKRAIKVFVSFFDRFLGPLHLALNTSQCPFVSEVQESCS